MDAATSPKATAIVPEVSELDFNKFRLRRFVDRLIDMGEMEIHEDPVALTKSSTIIDKSVHRVGIGTVQGAFFLINNRSILWHKHPRLNSRPRRISGQCSPRITSRGCSQPLNAKFIGHSYRHCHTAGLEAAGG